MTLNSILRLTLLLLAAMAALHGLPGQAASQGRPNILWFVVDDMSANLSCYGEKTIQTPNIDRLAREGTRFTNAFITAPVCSPCRSALITGMYQTSIGAQNHRSGRGEVKVELPQGVRPIPELFREAGYYTCNGNGRSGSRLAKTDYNFEWDPSMYDGADWAGRKAGQPFFMQVQLAGGKHRDGNGWRRLEERFGDRATRPADVTLPPYYPRDPAILQDWAHYLDAVRVTDLEVGEVMDRLAREGLLENTLVIFMTDHGISHARGKQFLYNEGTHVPFIIRGPGITPGKERRDLIEHIDMAALSLAAAGIAIPAKMQSRDILSASYKPRDAVFAARDRCDETVDQIRSARTDRWLYIRNGYPMRPHLQPNNYKDNKPTYIALRRLHAEGKLPELTEKLLFSPTRPREELYDWQSDPWQIKNLAADPAHAATLAEMRGRLTRWQEETGDQGRHPEPPAQLESDMAVYLNGTRNRPEAHARIEANIALMKRWAAEGK